MHQPTATAHPSLYYDYRVHPYVPPPERLGQGTRHRVVIVGAGPIGLATALDLARYGIASVVLESELQVVEGSRAIVFTRRSMEILQQVGVAASVTAKGLPWRYGNSFYRGQRVFRMEAPHPQDDRFGPLINLQQQYLEGFCVSQIEREPLIDLRWGNHVTGIVHNDGDHATLSVDTPDGGYEIDSEWVIATDGARSGLRQTLGLKMQGDAYEGRFVIADIRIKLDLPTERLAFFDPIWNPGNTVLMHREPDDMWRIDYQLPPGEAPEQALQIDSLTARINAQLEMIGAGGTPWELDWYSVYSARAMTLSDYVCKRVIFAGDAAHMLPIFGVRGANTGLQDGHNLAWKLAFVLRGWGSPRLLDTYSEERVAAAREIVGEAGKSTRFMTPPSRGFRLLRDATLSLSLQHEFVRPLFHWRTSRPHEYLSSSLNYASAAGPHGAPRSPDGVPGLPDGVPGSLDGVSNGAPVPNVCLGPDDYLFDHLGASFYLFYYTAEPELPEALHDAIAEVQQRGFPFEAVAIVPAGRRAAPPVLGAAQTFSDESGRFAALYGFAPGGAQAYLVRPDQHTSAHWRTDSREDSQKISAASLKAALHSALGLAHGAQSR
jgi:3-(3-hydroxy-phenyl)propionate hydroxylase